MDHYGELYHEVSAFQKKYGYPINLENLKEDTSFDGQQALESITAPLHVCEYQIRRAAGGDQRVFRTYLMLEELREWVEAAINNDEVAAADALTDLLYTVIGSMVTYGYPTESLFYEVQGSNMSKDVGDTLKPEKGKDYYVPNIQEILNAVSK